MRRNGRVEDLLIHGPEPVTLLLHFHSLLAGKTIEVIPGDGITVQPANRFLQVGATGEGVLLVGVEETKSRGVLGFRVDNVTTALRFVRVPLWALAEKERRALAENGR